MSPLTRAAVWAKAKDGPFGMKVDDHGNPMAWDDYGNADSPFGWEIDHYPMPKALGGGDHLENLRALNCSANRSQGAALGNALRRPASTGIFGFGRRPNPFKY